MFFRTVANQIMVASYTVEGDTFKADKPQLWSEQSIQPRPRQRPFDLHLDGERFAVSIPPETQIAGNQDSPIFHTLRGRAEVEGSLRDLYRAFSDYSIEIDDLVIGREPRERAVLVWSSKATHCGEIFGMPGTGRRIENQVAFIFTFEDGKIAQDRRIYDAC